jgi:hypothetical protein
MIDYELVWKCDKDSSLAKYGAMTFSITTLSITTFSITTLSVKTFSITTLNYQNHTQLECCYANCHLCWLCCVAKINPLCWVSLCWMSWLPNYKITAVKKFYSAGPRRNYYFEQLALNFNARLSNTNKLVNNSNVENKGKGRPIRNATQNKDIACKFFSIFSLSFCQWQDSNPWSEVVVTIAD